MNKCLCQCSGEQALPQFNETCVIIHGWGMFLTTLDYKCRWNGKNLIRIGRFQPGSRLCNCCGYKMDSMPLSIREWECPECNAHHDRDGNAARNIRDIGLADSLGHSGCVRSPPVDCPVSAGSTAKSVEYHRYGSQEAPTIPAWRLSGGSMSLTE